MVKGIATVYVGKKLVVVPYVAVYLSILIGSYWILKKYLWKTGWLSLIILLVCDNYTIATTKYISSSCFSECQ